MPFIIGLKLSASKITSLQLCHANGNPIVAHQPGWHSSTAP
jgi:hypothetical protein